MATPTLYLVSDGKAGHLAQSRGLAEAIKRLTRARVMEIEAEGKRNAPQPEKEAGLILACGRSTHGMAIALRKYLGVPAICLMNPGWIGRQRFDLSIIPRHDGIKASASIILTEGALNPLTPASNASPEQGLILVGGPSKHHRWDEQALGRQIGMLLDNNSPAHWSVTGSRRTPESTDRLLRDLARQHGERFVYTPASQTPAGWVAQQLQRCGVCWVSEDSISMIYEALTAHAQVGLLSVPRKRWPGRVVRGVQSLVDRGWVTDFERWQSSQNLKTDRPPLAEADRVARLVLERYPIIDL